VSHVASESSAWAASVPIRDCRVLLRASSIAVAEGWP
jgi:hypothetical protein